MLAVGLAFAHGDPVADRIARFHQKQLVVVEADGGGVTEWVAVAVGEEEMLPGVDQFLSGRVGAAR